MSVSPRVAYAPNSPDLTGPGDRRRFCHYASRRGVRFEVARPTERYDVVIATGFSDIGTWSRAPAGTRVVFDMVDSILAEPRGSVHAALRGVARFAFGRARHLDLDYRRCIEAMCRRADVVLCASEEQRAALLPYCANTHAILDFQTELTGRPKTEYARGDVFHLFWEGLPWNLRTFRGLRGVLERLKARHAIALHLVTSPTWPLAFGTTGRVSTRRQLRGILPMGDVYLYDWNLATLPALAAACDLAVIPIPLDRPFLAAKPENKLLQMWRMGLPAIVSATPSYERAMREAGLAMTCRTEDEWEALLERALGDEAWRADAGRRGRAFAERTCAEDRLLAQWDAALAGLLAGA